MIIFFRFFTSTLVSNQKNGVRIFFTFQTYDTYIYLPKLPGLFSIRQYSKPSPFQFNTTYLLVKLQVKQNVWSSSEILGKKLRSKKRNKELIVLMCSILTDNHPETKGIDQKIKRRAKLYYSINHKEILVEKHKPVKSMPKYHS